MLEEIGGGWGARGQPGGGVGVGTGEVKTVVRGGCSVLVMVVPVVRGQRAGGVSAEASL